MNWRLLPGGRRRSTGVAFPDQRQRLENLRRPLERYFSRNVDNRADVDDLVQDVFARVLKRTDFENDEHLTGYVFRAAASVLADRNRRRQSHATSRHVAFDAEMHGCSGPGPEAALEARDDLRTTSLVLMELPERVRAVFVLRRLEQCSFAEIARRLGISLSSAEKDMAQATRHLYARTRGEL